jgi:hypothetical protein
MVMPPSSTRGGITPRRKSMTDKPAPNQAESHITRDDLVAFYSEHEPSKIANVDTILSKASTERICDMLQQKYGESPKTTPGKAPRAAVTAGADAHAAGATGAIARTPERSSAARTPGSSGTTPRASPSTRRKSLSSATAESPRRTSALPPSATAAARRPSLNAAALSATLNAASAAPGSTTPVTPSAAVAAAATPAPNDAKPHTESASAGGGQGEAAGEALREAGKLKVLSPNGVDGGSVAEALRTCSPQHGVPRAAVKPRAAIDTFTQLQVEVKQLRMVLAGGRDEDEDGAGGAGGGGATGPTKVKVVCRLRPANRDELARGAAECWSLGGDGSVSLLPGFGRDESAGVVAAGSDFKFDAVLGPRCSQQDVYATVEPVVQSVLQVSVLWYGRVCGRCERRPTARWLAGWPAARHNARTQHNTRTRSVHRLARCSLRTALRTDATLALHYTPPHRTSHTALHPSYLPTYLPTYLRTYLPTYLPTQPPTERTTDQTTKRPND